MSVYNKWLQSFRIDASSNSITTSAYDELDSSLDGNILAMEIYNSTGQVLRLAHGPAGSEVDDFYIMPGGNGLIYVQFDIGARLAVTAVDGNATSGQLIINCYA